MLNFIVAIVDCSYMFLLLQSNHHQAVYQKVKQEIVLTKFGVRLFLGHFYLQ